MTRTLATGLLVALTGLAVIAQGRPDFSGAWALDKESSVIPQMSGGPGGGRMGGMAAESIAIKQTASELTREAQMPERTITRIYKLDGSQSVNETPRGQLKSTSKWDGMKLVTSATSEGENPAQVP